jgi:adenylosuccinate synthase
MKKAVIGLAFGDEGKGLVVDYLTLKSENMPLIVRFSGGQQAGHGVFVEDKKHIFSNFGSGTLRGASTYWSKFCTVDPVGLSKELDILIEKGINPKIYIDGDSPVTTPYDKFHNKNNKADLDHGTCGLGIGSTINREEHYHSFTFSDLFYPWILDTKLELIKNFYGNIDLSEAVEEFLTSCYRITNCDNVKLTYGIPTEYSDSEDIIFEGSQGLLLDQWYGFFPHVARTNTGTKNILGITDKNFEVYLVTRAYQTRHGNGPMTNNDIDIEIKIDADETNINNKYQGEFKRKVLDVSLLKYAMNKDKYIRETLDKVLVITCLDHLTEYVFTYDEKLIYCKDEKEFVSRISNILEIEKVYVSRSHFADKIEEIN